MGESPLIGQRQKCFYYFFSNTQLTPVLIPGMLCFLVIPEGALPERGEVALGAGEPLPVLWPLVFRLLVSPEKWCQNLVAKSKEMGFHSTLQNYLRENRLIHNLESVEESWMIRFSFK